RLVFIRDYQDEFTTVTPKESRWEIEIQITGNSLEVTTVKDNGQTTVQSQSFRLYDETGPGPFRMDTTLGEWTSEGITEVTDDEMKRAVPWHDQPRPTELGAPGQRFSVWERVSPE